MLAIVRQVGCACLFLFFTQLSIAEWIDASDQLEVSNTRPTFDRINRVYFTYIDVVKTSADDIDFPARVLIEDSTLPVLNADGVTGNGTPYFAVPVEDFAQAEDSIRLRVDFTLQRARLTFTALPQIDYPTLDIEFEDRVFDIAKEVGGVGDQTKLTLVGDVDESITSLWSIFDRDGNSMPFLEADESNVILVAVERVGRYSVKVMVSEGTQGVELEDAFEVKTAYSNNPPENLLEVDASGVGVVKTQYFIEFVEAISSEALSLSLNQYCPGATVIAFDDVQEMWIIQVPVDYIGCFNQLDDSIGIQSAFPRPYYDPDAELIHQVEGEPFIPNDPYCLVTNKEEISCIDPISGQEGYANWHLEGGSRYSTNVINVWDDFRGSTEQLIGVADNGYFRTHEDYNKRRTREVAKLTGQERAHGTQTASVIGLAYTDNNKGIAGINHNAKFITGLASKWFFSSIVEEIKKRTTASSPASVINYSVGLAGYIDSDFDNQSEDAKHRRFCKAVRDSRWMRDLAIKNSDKILFVFSAGNGIGNGGGLIEDNTQNGIDEQLYGVNAMYGNGALHYDASGYDWWDCLTSIDSFSAEYAPLDNVVVVGAVEENGSLAYYSNFGESVDIAAPTNILSLTCEETDDSECEKNSSTRDTAVYNGTSAAAPVITGIASLLLSYPELNLSPAQAKQALINSGGSSILDKVFSRNRRNSRCDGDISELSCPDLDILCDISGDSPQCRWEDSGEACESGDSCIILRDVGGGLLNDRPGEGTEGIPVVDLEKAVSYALAIQNPPSEGLYAYYPFDNTTEDVSPNNRNATAIGGSGYTAGVESAGILLDGNDDYIDIPNQCFDNFTFTAFVRSDYADSEYPVANTSNGVRGSAIISATKIYENFVVDITEQEESFVFRAVFRGAGNFSVTSDTEVQSGQFYHVAASYDGQDLKLYVDGTLEAVESRNEIACTGQIPDIEMGQNRAERAKFKGVFDEVRLYGSALSDVEIAGLAE